MAIPTFPPAEVVAPRVRLRRPRLDDAEAVFAYTRDPVVTRHMSFRTHTHLDEATGYLQRSVAAWDAGAGHRPWIIEPLDGGALLGAIGADLNGCRVDVGYILRRDQWGRGIMPEALAAVRDAALADPRVWRIQAWHDVENPASGRVMEKVGMQREGRLRRYAVFPNLGEAPRDAWMWALVRS